MSAESLIRTIGTALGQAQAHELVVAIRVEGEWLMGLVQSKDGEGVVLTDPASGDLMIVRLAAISAVRITAQAVTRLALPHPTNGVPATTV
jgi:hypothetical protein